jgi:hypothetical protein
MKPTHIQSSWSLIPSLGLYHFRFLELEGAGVAEGAFGDVEEEEQEVDDEDTLEGSSRGS